MDLAADSSLKTGEKAPLVANIWCMCEYCRCLSHSQFDLCHLLLSFGQAGPQLHLPLASLPSGIVHVCNRAPTMGQTLLQVLYLLDMLHSVPLVSLNFKESNLMCLFLDDQVFFIPLFTEKVAMGFFCLFSEVLPISQHESTSSSLQGVHNRKSNT